LPTDLLTREPGWRELGDGELVAAQRGKIVAGGATALAGRARRAR